MIHRIKDVSGKWIMDDDEIGAEAIGYFGTLFSVDPIPEYQLLHAIPNLSSDINNNLLEAIPSLDEVKKVIFDMDGDSVARPDRFTGKFFTFAWEMIAQDVYEMIVSFSAVRNFLIL